MPFKSLVKPRISSSKEDPTTEALRIADITSNNLDTIDKIMDSLENILNKFSEKISGLTTEKNTLTKAQEDLKIEHDAKIEEVKQSAADAAAALKEANTAAMEAANAKYDTQLQKAAETAALLATKTKEAHQQILAEKNKIESEFELNKDQLSKINNELSTTKNANEQLIAKLKANKVASDTAKNKAGAILDTAMSLASTAGLNLNEVSVAYINPVAARPNNLLSVDATYKPGLLKKVGGMRKKSNSKRKKYKGGFQYGNSLRSIPKKNRRTVKKKHKRKKKNKKKYKRKYHKTKRNKYKKSNRKKKYKKT